MSDSQYSNGSGADDATLDAPLGKSKRRPAHPRAVCLVEGSGPGMSGETQALLRSRLKAAALILFMGFGVFLLWRLAALTLPIQAAGLRTDPGMLIGHGLVTALLGLCALSVCRSCATSGRILRLKELAIFAIPACYFVGVQYANMSVCAAADHYMPNPAGVWLMLIFTYAMFIPNHWRRAAAVVGAMAAAPVLVCLCLWWMDDACAAFLHDHRWFFVELLLGMLVAAIGATAGVYTINALRHEAFEARQLGQYRLGRRIGGGGMGEVYLAEHQMMKRPCAIKLIRPEKAGDPQVLARFEREVRASAKLSHWNNIDIFDYGRAACGTFYYVMEYLPGLNLGELVQRHGPLPAERAIHLMCQVCAALGEAHAAGLIHRDIKPANVFAAKRGGFFDVAKLLDFGLAKPITGGDSIQLTQEGSIAGSPLFMSPEQATADKEPDVRSDIYSLGALMYYLLAGQPPFNDQRPIRVLVAHARDDPAPPSRLQSGIPADLERVVLRCLAKRPDDRFQSAADLASALDQCSAAGDWTKEMAARWWREQESRGAQPLELAVG